MTDKYENELRSDTYYEPRDEDDYDDDDEGASLRYIVVSFFIILCSILLGLVVLVTAILGLRSLIDSSTTSSPTTHSRPDNPSITFTESLDTGFVTQREGTIAFYYKGKEILEITDDPTSDKYHRVLILESNDFVSSVVDPEKTKQITGVMPESVQERTNIDYEYIEEWVRHRQERQSKGREHEEELFFLVESMKELALYTSEKIIEDREEKK